MKLQDCQYQKMKLHEYKNILFRLIVYSIFVGIALMVAGISLITLNYPLACIVLAGAVYFIWRVWQIQKQLIKVYEVHVSPIIDSRNNPEERGNREYNYWKKEGD